MNVFQILGVPIANALIAVSFFFNACPLLRSECKSSLFETNSDSNPIAALSKQASVWHISFLGYIDIWHPLWASRPVKFQSQSSQVLLKPPFLFQFIATYFRKVDYSRFWSPWRPLNHMVFLHSEVLGYHIFSLLSLWHHHTSYYRESNFPRHPNHHQLKATLRQRKNNIRWNLWWIWGETRTLNLVSRRSFFLSETGQGTAIVFHSKYTKNALTVKKYHRVEAKIWGKFVICLWETFF